MRLKTLGAMILLGLLAATAGATTTSGTVTNANDIFKGRQNHLRLYTWTWASDSLGRVLDNTVVLSGPGEIVRVIFDPDNVAFPTSDYDVTLTDVESWDVLNGAGANRHTANTEVAVPRINNVSTVSVTETDTLTTRTGTQVFGERTDTQVNSDASTATITVAATTSTLSLGPVTYTTAYTATNVTSAPIFTYGRLTLNIANAGAFKQGVLKVYIKEM